MAIATHPDRIDPPTAFHIDIGACNAPEMSGQVPVEIIEQGGRLPPTLAGDEAGQYRFDFGGVRRRVEIDCTAIEAMQVLADEVADWMYGVHETLRTKLASRR